MVKIPFSVAKYIRSLWMSERVVTYLHIDIQGNLADWGGYPNYYGLSNLVIGQLATEQVFFLEGLLPVTHTETLQFLRMGTGGSAHIYLIPYQDSTWVLMFDATTEYERQQKIQQQANELSLLSYRQSQLVQKVEETRQALATEKQQLEQTSQAKGHLLATLSHELRTPLASIINSTKLLEDIQQANQQETDYLAGIKNNADYLLALIDNILDQTKLEMGQVVLQPSRVEVKQILAELVDLFLPIAQNKGLSFEVESQPTLPCYLIIDGLRFRQILINLINNAIKYTEQGFVKVTVAWQDERLKFAVADSGLGIPPESQEKIFIAFHREQTTRSLPSIGLGLAISLNLVRMMEGELQVADNTPTGSIFSGFIKAPAIYYSLPNTNIAPHNRSTTPAKILIVDDDKVSCSLIEVFLRERNYAVISAHDGSEAINTGC